MGKIKEIKQEIVVNWEKGENGEYIYKGVKTKCTITMEKLINK